MYFVYNLYIYLQKQKTSNNGFIKNNYSKVRPAKCG